MNALLRGGRPRTPVRAIGRLTVVTASLLLAAASPATPQQPASAANAIRTRVAEFAAAINRRDATAIAALYLPDGDFVFFDGPRVTGSDAIKKDTEHAIASWPATMRFTLEVTSIRFLRPDVAIVETLAQFSEGEMRSNRGTAVMVRHSGKWFYAALRVFPAQRA